MGQVIVENEKKGVRHFQYEPFAVSTFNTSLYGEEHQWLV